MVASHVLKKRIVPSDEHRVYIGEHLMGSVSGHLDNVDQLEALSLQMLPNLDEVTFTDVPRGRNQDRRASLATPHPQRRSL